MYEKCACYLKFIQFNLKGYLIAKKEKKKYHETSNEQAKTYLPAYISNELTKQ